MISDAERALRASELPIVDGLPDLPGILVAMNLSPELGAHLRGLADTLLVHPFPGSTLSRAERELLATITSAGNKCFFCMDSHGSFAAELFRRQNVSDGGSFVDSVKSGNLDRLEPKLAALGGIAKQVGRDPRLLARDDIRRAKTAGASDGDVQLTILIAAAFCMYNRMVDGPRAKTPANVETYGTRARAIADHGYSSLSRMIG